MTMPADITSDAAWDRLTTVLRAIYRDIDTLYQRITAPDAAEEPPQPEETDLVSDRDAAYGTGADDRAAEYDDEQRERLDAETDGHLDGDYDTDVDDAPDLDG